jgi:hypothetical protein
MDTVNLIIFECSTSNVQTKGVLSAIEEKKFHKFHSQAERRKRHHTEWVPFVCGTLKRECNSAYIFCIRNALNICRGIGEFFFFLGGGA